MLPRLAYPRPPSAGSLTTARSSRPPDQLPSRPTQEQTPRLMSWRRMRQVAQG